MRKKAKEKGKIQRWKQSLRTNYYGISHLIFPVEVITVCKLEYKLLINKIVGKERMINLTRNDRGRKLK